MMKKALAVILASIIAGSIITVGAVYWIYSNQVTVTVGEYALTLSADPDSVAQYEEVTLTAILTLDTTGVEGATIRFYRVVDTTRNLIGTNKTDSNGYATWIWNATLVGSVTFEAGYQVAT